MNSAAIVIVVWFLLVEHKVLKKDLNFHSDFKQNTLTIRKTAARRVSLHFTSKSIGNETPKLSASVKDSCKRPDHCFDKLPTGDPSIEAIS